MSAVELRCQTVRTCCQSRLSLFQWGMPFDLRDLIFTIDSRREINVEQISYLVSALLAKACRVTRSVGIICETDIFRSFTAFKSKNVSDVLRIDVSESVRTIYSCRHLVVHWRGTRRPGEQLKVETRAGSPSSCIGQVLRLNSAEGCYVFQERSITHRPDLSSKHGVLNIEWCMHIVSRVLSQSLRLIA